MVKQQNYINHIVLVLDASSSMAHLAPEVIKVADAQIAHLAQRSKELDQETRITVYTFNERVECVIYDMDVLRLPSIAKLYSPFGWTALIDATLLSQDDLALTPVKYGYHAFLTFVLTDGQDNRSFNRYNTLAARLNSMPDNWTVAVLVPNQNAVFEAKRFGFPKDNIAVWDTSTKGVTEVGEVIRNATESFMTGRSQGVHGYRNLFSMGADALNKATLKSAQLKPLHKSKYRMLKVQRDWPIREFVEEAGVQYTIGIAYYQLTKRETIQPQKNIAVRNKKTGTVYTGTNARDLLGLPNMEVRVSPDYNPEFDVFVQSTSVNRKLIAGTELLLML